MRDLSEWLKDFTEIPEDEGVLASRDTLANTSQDSDSERPAKVVSRKQQYPYILPKRPRDRNFEIRKKTKITGTLCRKRTGDAVPRAENFGDLTTAYHKVRNEESESRNNHRHAVVVQDLAIQRIRFYPCTTENGNEFTKVSSAAGRAKSHFYRQFLGFGKSCEELSGNH